MKGFVLLRETIGPFKRLPEWGNGMFHGYLHLFSSEEPKTYSDIKAAVLEYNRFNPETMLSLDHLEWTIIRLFRGCRL